MSLTDEWINEQLEICEKAVPPGQLVRSADARFIAAAREGYPLVLKEVLRLKRVIYSAHEDLMEGESGHAVKTLDDDREPGSASYYD